MDVLLNFGDSRSNRSRDIRLPYFVTDDERMTTMADGRHNLTEILISKKIEQI